MLSRFGHNAHSRSTTARLELFRVPAELLGSVYSQPALLKCLARAR